MSSRKRYAVVGIGSRSHMYIEALIKDYGAGNELVALCDSNRGRLEQRLAWAGLPVAAHDFALVTTHENMHAAKPSTAYYREIVDLLGLRPQEALMVGDDWDNDIMPANRQKIGTFWVVEDDVLSPAPLQATSRGSLEKLVGCFRSGWLDSFN